MTPHESGPSLNHPLVDVNDLKAESSKLPFEHITFYAGNWAGCGEPPVDRHLGPQEVLSV